MEIIFHQKIMKLNNRLSTDNVIEKINELLNENYYFSHFIADGIEILDSHEDFLKQNINEIQRIEIIAKTVEEFVNDIFLSAEVYINRSYSELLTLADEFYDNPNSDTWNRFNHLIEGIQWLNDSLSLIGESTTSPIYWEEFIQVTNTLKETLKNLEEALENEDFVLIGDLIQYEIINNYKNLGEVIKKTIDTEGTRNDIN